MHFVDAESMAILADLANQHSWTKTGVEPDGTEFPADGNIDPRPPELVEKMERREERTDRLDRLRNVIDGIGGRRPRASDFD